MLQFVAASQECVCIGQFARLLPTLVVVAVSQAPSPESNPNSPLPVTATVVHYTTVQADRSEVLAIKLRLWPGGHGLASTGVPQGPAWVNQHAAFPRHWSSQRLGAIHHREADRLLTHRCVADLGEWVLATGFQRISLGCLVGDWHQPHSIAQVTTDVRSHSQTHCGNRLL